MAKRRETPRNRIKGNMCYQRNSWKTANQFHKTNKMWRIAWRLAVSICLLVVIAGAAAGLTSVLAGSPVSADVLGFPMTPEMRAALYTFTATHAGWLLAMHVTKNH